MVDDCRRSPLDPRNAWGIFHLKEFAAAVFFEDPACAEKAAEWARFLKCEVNPKAHDGSVYRLHFAPEFISLKDPDGRILKIDFDRDQLNYSRSHRGKNELLAKAVGSTKGIHKVLDISVGMAIDSIFLTQLGFEVTGVERSPLLYVLLKEAFQKTAEPTLKDYQLHFAEAADFLKDNLGKLSFDAIYFDPMYPHKKKSALPKQEMVLFRDLVGHDEDAAEVLREAMKWDCQRVVVKRPIGAAPLLPGAIHNFEGKLVRYDVYRKVTK